MVAGKRVSQRVEWASTNVAEHDTQRSNCKVQLTRSTAVAI